MKAEMNSDGELEVYAETDLELYALRSWYENNKKHKIVHNLPRTYKDDGCTISPSVVIHTNLIMENE